MADRKILVCQGSDCSRKCSPLLLRDIEELCRGTEVGVEATTCRDHCGKGPNVQLKHKDTLGKIIEKIDSFKAVDKLLKSELNIDLKKLTKQVGEIKYEARRSKDSEERLAKIEKAWKALGGEEKGMTQEPQLSAELLVLRSREALASKNAEAALEDAKKAAKLQPSFGQAHACIATAYEKLQKWTEALEAATEAISKGELREGSAIQRRAKEKVKEQEAAQKAEAEKKKAEESATAEAEAAKKEALAKKQAEAKKKKEAAEAKKKALAEKQAEEARKLAEEQARKEAEAAELERARLEAEREAERLRLEAEAEAKRLEEERLRAEEERKRAEQKAREEREAEARRKAEAEEQARLDEVRRQYEASFQGRLEALLGCCRSVPTDGHDKDGEVGAKPVLH